MSGVGGTGSGARIVRPAEVSLAQVMPAAANDADVAYKAPLGIVIDNVHVHERGGLETITLDIDASWAARQVGAQDSRATIAERIDADGAVTGVRGQLYAEVTMTAADSSERIGQFNALVSPAASGGVTLSFLGYPASMTIDRGQIHYAQGVLKINGELKPVD